MRIGTLKVMLFLAVGAAGCSGCQDALPPLDASTADVGIDASPPLDLAPDTLDLALADAAVDTGPDLTPDLGCGGSRKLTPTAVKRGPGMACGKGCKQVTFGARANLAYEVEGDLLVYTGGGAVDARVYLVDLKADKEWLVQSRPQGKPGCLSAGTDGKRVAYSCILTLPTPNPTTWTAPLQLFDPTTGVEQDLQCIHLTEKTGHDPEFITIGSTGIAMMASLKGSGQVDTFFHRFSDKSFTNLSNKYGTVFHQNMWGPLVVWAELIKPVLQVVLYDTVKNTKKVLNPTGKSQFKPRIEGDKVVWTDHRNAPGTYWNHGDSDIYLHDLKTGKTTVVIKHPARQDEPDVWGDWVVWEDWRNNPNPTPKYGSEFKESDIFAKNLKTGKEVQLTSLKGMEQKPHIEDGRVFFRAISWTSNQAAYFMIDLKALGY